MIDTMVIFGATGDLTGRLLLPALAALRADGGLGPQFRLVGAGPQDWTTEQFTAHARHRLAEHAPSMAGADALVDGLRYRRADVTDPAAVTAVLDAATQAGSGPVVVYLALPTQLMLDAVRALPRLPAGSRVAIEKPFGHDAASAHELNAALAPRSNSDSATVYRVDHALAMTAVQRLRSARHPATGEQLAWNNRRIAQVELLWEETLALEGRASFYDRAGALRDVMQNHLVQVLCTIAALDGADRSACRAEVLRAVRPMTPADVPTHTRRARYTAGRLAPVGGATNRTVPDYVAEDGVDPARNTETFAEVVLGLDSPEWVGTRFVLRAGKALAARRRGVAVHPRSTNDGPVWLDLDDPNDDGAPEPGAYQSIVTDLLGGGSSYAVGAEEVELAWRVFAPVLQGWADDVVTMANYPAGSTGPR